MCIRDRWWDEEEKCYIQPKSGTKLTQQELVDMWTRFADTYPTVSYTHLDVYKRQKVRFRALSTDRPRFARDTARM